LASKVALLIINQILPVDKFETILEAKGYSCLTLDRFSSDIELPIFNIAIVGLDNEKTYLKLKEKTDNYDGVVLFFTGKHYSEIANQIAKLPESLHIEPNFSGKELELAIQLQLLKKQIQKAENFASSNFDTNHVRLKKIITEEQAWRIIFEQSPNGVLLSDDEGNIIYTNSAATDILGYTRDEFLKMRFHDLAPKELAEQVDTNIKKILRGESLITEVYNIRKDGSKRYVQLHETRVIFPNGKYGIMVISTDISRAKQAEEALKESMEMYRILVEHSNDGIVFVKEGIVIYGNPRIIEILNAKPEEFLNQPITKFIHPSQKEFLLQRYKNRLAGKSEPTIYETILVSSQNEEINVEFNVNLVDQAGEKIDIVFIRDITTRKQAEKAIKESEESYKGLFNNSSEGILIIDSSGVILDANRSGLILFGYSKDELLGKTIHEITDNTQTSLEEVTRSVRLAYQGHTQKMEFWGIKKNNDLVPIDMVFNRGDYFGLSVVFAMCHDITDRKNAEAVLRESEEKYRTLTEQIPVGLYRILSNGQIVYCNPAFAEIFGFSSSQAATGSNIKSFLRDFDKWLVDCSTAKLPIEVEMLRADGSTIWVQNILQPNVTENPDATYFDGMLTDVTDRKVAIDELTESEAKFRAMLLAIPDHLFRLNREGILIDFAPTDTAFYPEITNLHLGKSIAEIFPSSIYEKYSEALSYASITGKLQRFEYSFKQENSIFYYEARIVPAGEKIFLVLLRDITQQKKFEEEIRILAQTIMNANDSISITDLDGNFIYVNPAFTKVYGYSQTEILGKNINLIRPIGFDSDLSKEIHSATQKGGWKGEILNVRKDGTIFPIFLSTSPVYNEFNEPIASVGIANDITERKLIEQELIRAKEQAEESDRLKTAFLSNMSHEIRSPMNAVLGFIQLLKAEESITETGKQYIELIENSGNQLLALIEDIIDISKIQSNQIRINKTSFDFNELLRELYTIYSNQLIRKADQKTLLFKPEMPQESPFTIYSDPVRVRQILNNLLSNAIKFTPAGHIRFGYTLMIDEDMPYIQCYVQDTGIGISPEKQALIFERFRQADDTYTRIYGGSGLGLAISKGLVDLLGGHIWVESTEGQGSTFYFTIPFQEGTESGKSLKKEEQKTLSSELLKGKKILVVEDISEIRLYFERLLEPTGAKTLFAHNAREARVLFKKHKDISVVLLDIRLPDADGYTIAAEFKRLRPDLPIIAQTAYALQSEFNKSIESGCDDYVTKPIDSPLLIQKILSLIEKKSDNH